MANAAWLALAVMVHNLGRAVGQLAGPDLQRAPPPRCAAPSSPCPAGSSTDRRQAVSIQAAAVPLELRRGQPSTDFRKKDHVFRMCSASRYHRRPAPSRTAAQRRMHAQDPSQPHSGHPYNRAPLDS